MKQSILAGVLAIVCLAGTRAGPISEQDEGLDEGWSTALSAPIETMTIGGQSLRDVVVYGQTSNMVYLRHAGGLLGVRVAELDMEGQRLLGYAVPEEKTAPERSGFKLAGNDLSMQAEQMATMMGWGSDVEPGMGGGLMAGLGLLVFGVGGLMGLLAHLIVSWLLRMICRKANAEPGFLIWLPVLQVFPLLKAAGMSRRWPFAIAGMSLTGMLLMGISFELALVVSMSSSLLALGLWIAWSVKICLARGKNPVWSVVLLLPAVNLLGLIYLAVSE